VIVNSQTPPQTDSPPSGRKTLQANLFWLGGGLLAVLVLSITASFAPPIMKRLIIFYAIYGIASGMVLNWLAEELRPGWTKGLVIWGGILTVVGAVNMGWLSYQHFRKAREEFAAANPRDAVLEAHLQRLSEQDEELRIRYEEEKRRTKPLFPDYLAHRISGIADLKTPWPEIFWGIEVLGSGLLCAGTMHLRQRRDTESKQPPVTN